MTDKTSYDEMTDNMQNYSSKKEGSNSLSVEQLILLRYMVIADYPGSKYPIGFIIVLDGSAQWVKEHKEFHDKYPHLFRAMPWYEGRKVEEMPMYVKYDNKIYKVKEYGPVNVIGYPENGIGIDVSTDCTLPATAEEYISHINKTK